MKMLISDRLRTYRKFAYMHDRCNRAYLKKNSCYKGKKVCKRWSKFDNFLKDMGFCPKGLTLDRVDNNKGYSPSNCKWVTTKVQNLNKRTSIKIKYKGKERYLIEVGRSLGINDITLRSRRLRGDSINKILSPTLIKDSKAKHFHFFRGKKRSIHEIGKMINKNPQTIKTRLRLGWSFKDAILKPSAPRSQRRRY